MYRKKESHDQIFVDHLEHHPNDQKFLHSLFNTTSSSGKPLKSELLHNLNVCLSSKVCMSS